MTALQQDPSDRAVERTAFASVERLILACGSLQSVAELCPGCDSELGKDVIQVRSDGAVRHEKSLRDLAVGQPVGSKLRDLQLLGGQPVARVGRMPPDRFTCGAQPLTGARSPNGRAEGVEDLDAFAQRRTGVRASSLASQPPPK